MVHFMEMYLVGSQDGSGVFFSYLCSNDKKCYHLCVCYCDWIIYLNFVCLFAICTSVMGFKISMTLYFITIF